MPEGDRLYTIPQKLGGDGAAKLQTEVDQFRASSSASATAISAHTLLTSAGIAVASVGTSNVIALRLQNAQFRNQEAQSWVTVELRDGLITGNRLLGPFQINPGDEKRFTQDDLLGRAAYSSILMQIVSAAVNPPVSNGVIAVIGFTVERFDQQE